MPGPQVPWDKRKQPQRLKRSGDQGYFPGACVEENTQCLDNCPLYAFWNVLLRVWEEARDDAESISTDTCF